GWFSVKNKWYSSSRRKAWLAGIAILTGVLVICVGQAWTTIDVIVYSGCGLYEEIVLDQVFSGNLSSLNPVSKLVIGDVASITLMYLETQGIPVSVMLANNGNEILLNITHPTQLDLSNSSISLTPANWFYFSENFTLTISRVTTDTLFSVEIVATSLFYHPCGIRNPFYLFTWVIGLLLVGWGFKELNQLSKDILV
ncbi:MAG: hypothetical protein ACFFDP_13475, partial [Promethearchaeota archaeon]